MCLLRHFRAISNLSPAGSFRIFDDIAICLYFFLENTRQCFTHCCCERHSFGSISEGWGGRGRRGGVDLWGWEMERGMKMEGIVQKGNGEDVRAEGRILCRVFWNDEKRRWKWWFLRENGGCLKMGMNVVFLLKMKFVFYCFFMMIRTSFKWNMHIISFKTSIRSISYS